jgi:L-cysteine desulfidase
MRFFEYLREEWRPALGCTEPAAIAFAAASAAQAVGGEVKKIDLICDPRIYKNCYAVGIPHSGGHSGILWALAIGCQLSDTSVALEILSQSTPQVVAGAEQLVQRGDVKVRVDKARESLHIDCRVESSNGCGRALIEGDHTRLVRLERNGQPLEIAAAATAAGNAADVRKQLAEMSFTELAELARSLTQEDRVALRNGAEHNIAIARHGMSLLPERFTRELADDGLSRVSRLVCSGVYARMCGAEMVVMTLAGSGNKGITCSVPLTLWGRGRGIESKRVDEALAMACLVTSSTTYHLGALSAVCGCSNAAGMGIAAGVVMLEGGGEHELSLAITNMVGNVTGMICDGAKIGCAMKTMTAVDAGFRSATLALSDVGIPASDGVVGHDGMASLANLGRIARLGMASLDEEILAIMREKLETVAEASSATRL